MTSTRLRIAGVVLAGGRSTRMGTDKAALVVDGQAMVDRSLVALRHAGVRPLFIAGTHHAGAPTDAHVVPDARGSGGPLSGIVSTWDHISASPAAELADVQALAVLACDLPRIHGPLVRELIDALAVGNHNAAVAHDGEFMQPLVAIYRRSALDDMVAAWLLGERSVRRLFGRWDIATVAAGAGAGDADEPSDLAGHDVVWPAGHEIQPDQ